MEDLQAEGEDVKESWVMTRILSILPSRLQRLRLEEGRLQEDELHVSSPQNAFISRQGVRVVGC